MARPDSKKAPHQTTEKQEQTVRNACVSPPVQGQSDSQNSLYPEENLKNIFFWGEPGWMPMKVSEDVATDTPMRSLCIYLYLYCYSHKYLYT